MSSTATTYRVNYAGYMADVTGNQKTTSKSANITSGLKANPFLNQQNQPKEQNGIMPNYGGGAEKCARCSKNVYLAEKKTGAGRSFHSRCFSCEACNRKLDATTLSEHKGEIYCKTCYTRQFGVHGLVSGVTMSTEQPAREVRHSRRSSYGSDLDAPVITHQPTRQRAHSNDHGLLGEHSAIQHDELPKMFPWRNDVLPEQEHSPPTNKVHNNELDHIVDKHYQRPTSQIGFEKLVESNVNKNGIDNNNRQSTYTGEDDRHKYIFESEKTPYANGASALIDMPIVSPPKRMDSKIERIEMPTTPVRNTERSQSPSPTSTDVYRRENSREQHNDISDNFSRLTLNENHHQTTNGKYSNNNTNTIASENPLIKPTYSHSSSYETKHISENNFGREQNHSRDSSPSATVHSNRSPSPTSGYASSNAHVDEALRDSSSPPSAYVPEHTYLNTQTSTSSNTNIVDRRPSSPRQNERIPSGVNEFVSKSHNLAGNFSPPNAVGKYSTIGALIKPHRALSQQNTPIDDDFDN